MKKTIKLIEVETPKGEVFFQFRIVESILPEEETSAPKPQTAQGGNGSKPQNGDNKSQSAPGDPMTDSQKRYLFRIMAERGKTGEEAHEHLKGLFKAKNLRDVTKSDASQMIETLLSFTPAQGNGGGDGSPF